MNESISIKEGELTRKFSPIDKLKINNTDDTTSILVSKDDMNTGTLYAVENGIYIASEDGYDAYDEVVIRVTDESYDGSGEWKDVDPSDDYGRWDDETYQNYLTDPDGFDDTFNDPTKWDDEDLGENLDYKYGDDGISGIDPYTGNEENINLDEDGYLNEKVLPSSISITKEPDKTKYTDGETISYAGIQVTAYTQDGNVWTDEQHPNGIIPMDELTFTIHEAILENSPAIASSDLIPDGFPCTQSSAIINFHYDEDDKVPGIANYSVSGGAITLFNSPDGYTNYTHGIAASPSGGSMDEHVTYTNGREITGTLELSKTYTHNGKTVYYNNWNTSWSYTIDSVYPNSYGSTGSASDGEIAWTMIYGDIIEEGTMTIPVYWVRDDGETLEDSFTITVVAGEDSGGGGDSGDSTIDNNGEFTWGSKQYKANTEIDATVHFSNGIIWVEAGSWGSREYTVEQALDLDLIRHA